MVSQKSTSLFELFSFEFIFTIDILVKWFNDVFKSKFIELNEIQKQIFVKENPLNWSKTCCICGFKLSTNAKEGHEKTQNLTTWFDFIMQQEHLFLKNICSQDDLLKMERLKTLEDCYRNFEYFLEVVVLLDKCFSRLTNLNVLEDQETLKRFFYEDLAEYNDFSEVYDAIDDFKIVEKYGDYCRRKQSYQQNNWFCLFSYHGF